MIVFDPPLQRGILLKRYRRFLADICLDTGQEITAHCPNTGAMLGLTTPGTPVWVSPSQGGKLAYTWQAIGQNQPCIGMNTWLPNRLIRQCIQNPSFHPFSLYQPWRSEALIMPGWRIDFLSSTETKHPVYVEIKNVHHIEGSIALFPDSVTERGTKHLNLLINALNADPEAQAWVIYVIQRTDAIALDVAASIDPAYAQAHHRARKEGVNFLAFNCQWSPTSLELYQEVPVLS